MKIALLYGTETGNAEILCDDMEARLSDEHNCTITALADISPFELNPESFYIFVTSTYGNGDLPAGAAKFYDTLNDEKPDLGKIRFAIFGLGDMVFNYTFAQGSEKLMDALKQCKATMVGERGIYDASSSEMPEDIGLPWLEGIMSQVALEDA